MSQIFSNILFYFSILSSVYRDPTDTPFLAQKLEAKLMLQTYPRPKFGDEFLYNFSQNESIFGILIVRHSLQPEV